MQPFYPFYSYCSSLHCVLLHIDEILLWRYHAYIYYTCLRGGRCHNESIELPPLQHHNTTEYLSYCNEQCTRAYYCSCPLFFPIHSLPRVCIVLVIKGSTHIYRLNKRDTIHKYYYSALKSFPGCQNKAWWTTDSRMLQVSSTTTEILDELQVQLKLVIMKKNFFYCIKWTWTRNWSPSCRRCS